jgi:hypothetical protein
MDIQNPKTPEEWQLAVDAAAALRAVADLLTYRLIQGGPKINVQRCDKILERGRRRGVTPSRPVHELAIAMIAAINGEINGDSTTVAS